MARSLSIHDPVSYVDPLGPETQEPEMLTKGEAIVRTVRLGVPRYIAAQASGLDPATLRRWEARAAEVAELEEDQLTDNQRILRTFCAELTRADAEAASYAVAMVRKAMPADFRAAVALLERRYPKEFSKRIEVDTDPTEREPARMDHALASDAEATFAAAALPEGLTADDFLPPVTPTE